MEYAILGDIEVYPPFDVIELSEKDIDVVYRYNPNSTYLRDVERLEELRNFPFNEEFIVECAFDDVMIENTYIDDTFDIITAIYIPKMENGKYKWSFAVDEDVEIDVEVVVEDYDELLDTDTMHFPTVEICDEEYRQFIPIYPYSICPRDECVSLALGILDWDKKVYIQGLKCSDEEYERIKNDRGPLLSLSDILRYRNK